MLWADHHHHHHHRHRQDDDDDDSWSTVGLKKRARCFETDRGGDIRAWGASLLEHNFFIFSNEISDCSCHQYQHITRIYTKRGEELKHIFRYLILHCSANAVKTSIEWCDTIFDQLSNNPPAVKISYTRSGQLSVLSRASLVSGPGAKISAQKWPPSDTNLSSIVFLEPSWDTLEAWRGLEWEGWVKVPSI